MEVIGNQNTKTVLATNILSNILLKVPQNEEIHTGLKRHEDDDIIFIFGWTF